MENLGKDLVTKLNLASTDARFEAALAAMLEKPSGVTLSPEEEKEEEIWEEMKQVLEKGEKPTTIMGVDLSKRQCEIVEIDGRRMERIKQSYIDALRAMPPRTPIPAVNHELYDSMRVHDPEYAEERRASAIRHFNRFTKWRNFDADILAQYEATGTAYVPVEEHDDQEFWKPRSK